MDLWKKKMEVKLLNADKLNDIDIIAKRYGILPSEILKGNVQDMTLNFLVAGCGIDIEVKANKKALKKAERQGRRRR